jgi:hypothetical protein
VQHQVQALQAALLCGGDKVRKFVGVAVADVAVAGALLVTVAVGGIALL